jgi:hypothetical protein
VCHQRRIRSNRGRERIETTMKIDLAARSAFAERAEDISMVQSDHRLLGFQHQDYGWRGFIGNPILTDVVNQELFDRLRAILERDDAMHVMYAVENNCQVFATLDGKDLLPHRSAVEAVCSSLRILKPTSWWRNWTTSSAHEEISSTPV